MTELQTDQTTDAEAGEGRADAGTITEAQVNAAAAEAPTPAAEPGPKPQPLPEGQHWFWGTGRRKSSVARVRIRPGSGRFMINGKSIERHFSEMRDRNDMLAPLQATKTEGQLDVYVNVQGGGPSGQAGAIRLGLSRALKEYDPSTEQPLRDAGFLTVDARRVERKKYGQPGARRRFQFSKR